MSEFAVSEAPTTAKINQKTIFVGTVAPATPLEGKIWLDTSGADIAVKIRDKGSVNWRTIGIITSGVFKATDAELLDGQEGSYYQNSTNQNAGTLGFARLPDHSKRKFVSCTGMQPSGGATFGFNASKKFELLADANGEKGHLAVLIPPNVTSVSVFLWMRGGSGTLVRIDTRSVATGQDFGTDTGVADSLVGFGDGTNNIQRVDVSTAFNAASFIVSGNIIYIELAATGATTLGIVGLEFIWA